jgi:hypothetical protein
MEEHEGVLGNLPRSRPGTRSERRTKDGGKRPAKAAERAAQRAERGGGRAARPARGTEPSRAAGTAGTGSGEARAGGSHGDPVGDAVRAAAKLAGTGLRVTAGLAQEVMRRLPRS